MFHLILDAFVESFEVINQILLVWQRHVSPTQIEVLAYPKTVIEDTHLLQVVHTLTKPALLHVGFRLGWHHTAPCELLSLSCPLVHPQTKLAVVKLLVKYFHNTAQHIDFDNRFMT